MNHPRVKIPHIILLFAGRSFVSLLHAAGIPDSPKNVRSTESSPAHLLGECDDSAENRSGYRICPRQERALKPFAPPVASVPQPVKPTLTLIIALLIAPLTALAQSKDEVEIAKKAAALGWQNAPEEQSRIFEAARFVDANECQTVIPAARNSSGLSRDRILADLPETGAAFGKAAKAKLNGKGEW